MTGCVPLEPSAGGFPVGSGYPGQPGFGHPGHPGHPSQMAAGQGIGGQAPPGAAPYQPFLAENGQPYTPGTFPPNVAVGQPFGAGVYQGPGGPNLFDGGNASPGSGGGVSIPQQKKKVAQPDPSGDHPRGIPVPNRPGKVYSPHSRDQGLVDVSEWPSGTLVKDPFKPDQDLWFFVP